MNKNLNRAKQLLDGGASLAIVGGGGELTFNEHGVKTLLSLQSALAGASVADKVVGKAAAMLLVRGGAIEVYAEVVSEPALEVFKRHGVPCVFGELVPNIINRNKTGICPMEQAVLDENDIEKAYGILVEKTGGAR
ncbi:MAG: DUF1893 domain-containing protein [Clostridiales bacterium]|nr:DUF1893 domain-containing protein [Clostridiales bacterium]